MSRQILDVTIAGTTPLLMHSSSLLDPINPIGLELAAYHEKPRKSAADHDRISDLEFAGSLWLDGQLPCVPARTIDAALRQAAERQGSERRVRSAILIESDAPLSIGGPVALEALKRDPDFRLRSSVTVDGQRRIVTRPCFRRWAATIVIVFETSIIDRNEVVGLLTLTGQEIGIGAGRPRHGRFAVTMAEVRRLPAA